MHTLNDHRVTNNSYTLHLIETKKFKTNTIALKFSRPLEREQITERALLPFVLQKGSKNYLDERQLRLKLDELYGSKFSINSGKKGENHVITFVLDFPNEKFLPDENELVKNCLEFLYDVAMNPNVNEGSFNEKIVEKEKETLSNKIKAIIDEKMQYANMRLIDEMCKDEKFSIHSHGYLDDLPKIDPKSLYQTYEQMINEDQLDVYVVGDFNKETMEQQFQDVFQLKRNANVELTQSQAIKPPEVNRVIEKQKVQQAKLHIGYRTGITYSDEDYSALQVFNGVFGGFPHSKLFLNVREKHSLAYYAASRLESNKGLLIVFSGIAPEKFDQANEIINEQFEDIKNGKVTDDEIEQTKRSIIHQMKETIDRAGGIVEFFYQQKVGQSEMDLDEMYERIQAVTKEDIIKVANKIQLDTIYFLTAENGGEESE
ncbi:EF-P 5-aminopentanol modification-associated protein YfmF [Bacillaceae bacterium W0354]